MQHALGRLEEVAPRSRQPDARAVTLKHRNPQFALDPCYAPTDCRGLHTRGHSGSTNVKRLGNVDEGAEISEFHHALQTTMRSEEHTSELQSLMRYTHAVFCLTHKR